MDDRIDLDVLNGFVAEVADYLPTMRTAIGDFAADSTRVDVLEEAARMFHCVKGAAGMLGFGVLSQMAEHLEDYVCDLASGLAQESFDAEIDYPIAVDLLADTTAGLIDGRTGTIEDLTQIRNITARLGGRTTLAEPDPLADLQIDFDPLEAYGESPGDFGDIEIPLDVEFDVPIEPLPIEVTPVPAKRELDGELREIFQAEAEDLFATIRTVLPQIEANRTSPELIQGLRRAVHSLKGAAGAVGLKSVAKLSHRMEDLLDRLHEAGRAVADDEVRLLVATADALEGLTEGQDDDSAARLFETYESILVEVPESRVPVESVEEPIPEIVPVVAPAAPKVAERASASTSLRVPVERLDEMVRLLVELVTTRATVEQRLGDFARFADELRAGADRLRRVATRFDQHTLRDLPTGDRQATGPVNRIRGLLEGSASYGFDALEFDRYSDAHLLARELTESAIDVQTIAAELGALFGDLDGLQTRQGRVIGELEDRLFRLRMLPLSSIADRLGRALRGAAEAVGKQATFQVTGGETALDKTILDAMADPLGHLVRNAVAHGIESPSERRSLGKPVVGTVTLAAAREGNQVVLRVGDDGAGIDPERLRSTALARGFLSSEAASAARVEDLHRLLFLPGFTTTESVDEISGRGVGLDAVQAEVIRLKGTLSVESTPGVGTTFIVRLPLTLAITRALMVEARQQTFALPLDAVRGIYRADATQFAMVGSARVFREGNAVYPVVRLAESLDLVGEDPPTVRVPVVLVRAGDRDVALVVDRVAGGREVVVKGLGSHLRSSPGILGATLTGDGKVVLILNPSELIASERPTARATASSTVRSTTATRRRVLIVDDSASVRRVVAGVVQRAGWDPLTATDGMDALELLADGDRPAVILSDVEMPRMDGYELLAAVRADDQYQDIPVVMLTSRAHDKHRQKAMHLGAADYLVKPYEEETLLRVLAEVAGRPALIGATS